MTHMHNTVLAGGDVVHAKTAAEIPFADIDGSFCLYLDIEAYGHQGGSALDVRTNHPRLLTVAGQTGPVVIIDLMFVPLAGVLPFLAGRRIVGHNLLFDLSVLVRHGLPWPAKAHDTMIASQVLMAGMKNHEGHSLKGCMSRYLHRDIVKDQGHSDWSVPGLTADQIRYAADDVRHLRDLYPYLLTRLDLFDLIPTFELESDFLPTIVSMALTGVAIDQDQWRRRSEQAAAKLVVAEAALRAALPLPDEKPLREVRLTQKGEPRKADLAHNAKAAAWNATRKWNFDSWQQVIKAFQKVGVTLPSTNYEVLVEMRVDHPVLDHLLEYREIEKEANDFGLAWMKHIKPDGSVYPDWRQLGTDSGRMSCIAKGQRVMVPGGTKPIERVKVGEYVYTYTPTGELTLKRVTAKVFNGYRPTVRVVWQSIGNKNSTGELVCTPDHRIFSRESGWVEAGKLSVGDRVYHAQRDDSITDTSGDVRPRIYAAHSVMEQEQGFIKRHVFGAPNHFHIHHLDENTANNSIDNLAVMSPTAHARCHEETRRPKRTNFKGGHNTAASTASRRIRVSKFTLLRMLAVAGGRLTKVAMDFNTLKEKCAECGVRFGDVSDLYGEDEKFISRGRVRQAFETSKTTDTAAKRLRVGTRRLKVLSEYYGIAYSNHTIIGVIPHTVLPVFDLSVEDTHNFIVEEVCVHNCAEPNLQQMPRGACRKGVVAPPGRLLVRADFSQIEARIAALISGDEVMQTLFIKGVKGLLGDVEGDFDIHYYTSSQVLDKPIQQVTKDERQIGKSLLFGLLFGMQAKNLRVYCRTNYGVKMTIDEAEVFREKFFKVFPGLEAWHARKRKVAYKQCDFRTLTGRRRYIPEGVEVNRHGISLNTPVQGTGGDLLKLSCVELCNRRHEMPEVRVVALIHDEIITTAPEEQAKAAGVWLKDIMCGVGNKLIAPIPVDAEVKIGRSWGG